MKLALVISSLGGGGGERIMLDLARGWLARGHGVTIITLSSPATDAYPIPAGARRIALDCMGDEGGWIAAPWRVLRRLQRLRTALRHAEPDAVIGFMMPTTTLAALAAWRSGARVLVYELVDPGTVQVGAGYAWLRRVTYARAAVVLTQTPRAAAVLRRLAPGSDVRVAPGFVPPFVLEETPSRRATPHKIFLAVGRLAPQKGFDLLLTAFARVATALPDWSLCIVGSGALDRELGVQAVRLGIADRVEWVPRTPQPWDQATHDTIFVLSSRYEGFPNVLLEAMALGLPPVAFDCPSGPAEIVTPGVNGVLVPAGSVEALATAMRALASNPVLRQRLAAGALDVRRDWSLDRALDCWDQYLSPSSTAA